MFSELIKTNDLERFIFDNRSVIADLYNLSYEQLIKEKNIIDEFVLLNTIKIEELNYAIKDNINFILLLYDFCEQLSLTASMSVLWHTIQKNNIIISHRIDAANLFMLNIATADEYIKRFDGICDKLDYAIQNEEDNDKKVVGTFVNYYLKVLGLNEKWIKELKTEIKAKQNKHHFLKTIFLQEIFSYDVTNKRECKSKIISAKSAYLQKKHFQINFAANNYIISEQNTQYANLLKNIPKDINEIRKLSVSLLKDNSTYLTLNRGVSILTEEQQLFSYINSYGPMHFAKCEFAYKKLPTSFFQNSIEIYDWGAGQGLATMCYLDFLNKNQLEQQITKVTLIEPSQLAIARAQLHIQKYNNGLKINSVNKILDNLISTDFESSKENIKIHLFSNILDIEDFSIYSLNSLISSTFCGINYFICISPYITESKVFRLDYFSDYFNNNQNYESIYEIGKRSGEWVGYGSWSIVLKIFKTVL